MVGDQSTGGGLKERVCRSIAPCQSAWWWVGESVYVHSRESRRRTTTTLVMTTERSPQQLDGEGAGTDC